MNPTPVKIVNTIKNKTLEFAYRVVEQIDGEKKIKLISYKSGEKIKKLCRDNYVFKGME